MYYEIPKGAALSCIDGVCWEDPMVMYDVHMQEVETIDIVTSTLAAAYGSKGMNGLVCVYTKNKMGSNTIRKNEKGGRYYKHPGYSYEREFYSPNYGDATRAYPAKDKRTTLYWNPSIEIDSQESLRLEFYTGDLQSDYIVEIQGISAKGVCFEAFKTFRVEKINE